MSSHLARFKRYPSYKESGTEWLDVIPRHWALERLKTIASVRLSNVDKKSEDGQIPVRLCNYVDVYYNEQITSALPFMEATATLGQIERFSLRAEDVLITKDSEAWDDIAVPSVVAENLDNVLCGYHLALIRPNNDVSGRYLSRAFSAVGLRDQFRVAANGITRFGLGNDAITSAVFPVPPLHEQQAIVAFLDRETARIDTLVAKKKRLVELLREQDRSVVSHVIVKGLDVSVQTKHSGVEWLGEIPTHWSVQPLGQLVSRITYGFTNPMPTADDGPYMVTAFDIGDGKILFDQARRTTEEAFTKNLTDKSRPRHGDVLVTKDGTLGRVAVADGQRMCINQSVALLRFDSRVIDADFASLALRESSYQDRMLFDAGGTAIKHIYVSRLAKMPIAVPPLSEQMEIARYLSEYRQQSEALINLVKTAADKLIERREALISAAVAGKIDVREEVA